MKPRPLLIVSGSPASRVAEAAFKVHFPCGEVVDMSTQAGRDRLEQLLQQRADAAGGIEIDIIAR